MLLKILAITTMLTGTPIVTGVAGPLVLAQATQQQPSLLTSAIVPVILASLAVGGVVPTLIAGLLKRRETADKEKADEASRMWTQMLALSAEQGRLNAKVEDLVRQLAARDVDIAKKDAEIAALKKDLTAAKQLEQQLRAALARHQPPRPGTSGTSA